jgi:hypothetical protein
MRVLAEMMADVIVGAPMAVKVVPTFVETMQVWGKREYQ